MSLIDHLCGWSEPPAGCLAAASVEVPVAGLDAVIPAGTRRAREVLGRGVATRVVFVTVGRVGGIRVSGCTRTRDWNMIHSHCDGASTEVTRHAILEYGRVLQKRLFDVHQNNGRIHYVMFYLAGV